MITEDIFASLVSHSFTFITCRRLGVRIQANLSCLKGSNTSSAKRLASGVSVTILRDDHYKWMALVMVDVAC